MLRPQLGRRGSLEAALRRSTQAINISCSRVAGRPARRRCAVVVMWPPSSHMVCEGVTGEGDIKILEVNQGRGEQGGGPVAQPKLSDRWAGGS